MVRIIRRFCRSYNVRAGDSVVVLPHVKKRYSFRFAFHPVVVRSVSMIHSFITSYHKDERRMDDEAGFLISPYTALGETVSLLATKK